jgi:chromatin modification-related protein VID21
VSAPTDLFKWQATVNANPLSALVKGAKKCLGTADWETAFNELRFNRAMQRVEQLKAQGRWSFRQPKKQKGPPMAKSHWDWMLEEMVRLALRFSHRSRWSSLS